MNFFYKLKAHKNCNENNFDDKITSTMTAARENEDF